MKQQSRTRLGCLVAALVGAAVLFSEPSPAAEAAGVQADLFVSVVADLPPGSVGAVTCQFEMSTEDPIVMADWIDTQTGEHHLQYLTNLSPSGAGHVTTVEVHAVADPEVIWPGVQPGTYYFYGRESGARLRFSAAIFRAQNPSCAATIDGVSLPVQHLPPEDARIFGADDFDGPARVRVTPGVDAAVAGVHLHDNSGSLFGFFTDGAAQANLSRTRIVEPDGTTRETVGGRHRITAGAAGQWRFELDGAAVGSTAPILWLKDLPVGWETS